VGERKGEAIIASVFLIGSFALFAVAIILTKVCGRLPGWVACRLCAAVKQLGLGGRKRQYAGLPDLCLALRSVPNGSALKPTTADAANPIGAQGVLVFRKKAINEHLSTSASHRFLKPRWKDAELGGRV